MFSVSYKTPEAGSGFAKFSKGAFLWLRSISLVAKLSVKFAALHAQF